METDTQKLNNLGNAISMGGMVGATTSPKPKRNVTISEVENGFVVHFSNGGYSYGEKTYIVNTEGEIGGLVDSLFD